jgi:hypothetical protein
MSITVSVHLTFSPPSQGGVGGGWQLSVRFVTFASTHPCPLPVREGNMSIIVSVHSTFSPPSQGGVGGDWQLWVGFLLVASTHP